MRCIQLGSLSPPPCQEGLGPAHLGLRSRGAFHDMGGSRSPSSVRGWAEGPASGFKAPALLGRPRPPRRDLGTVRRGDSSLAAEDEEVQPGDSKGLEGSSAGAGEAVGPCSPSVSFSSRVDMRVLSPLRELVSTWVQQVAHSQQVWPVMFQSSPLPRHHPLLNRIPALPLCPRRRQE